MEIYSGYIKDEKKLLQSASGGAATALAEKVLRNGGVVFGVRYSDDFYRAEYCCIEKLDMLGKIKGTKYIRSEKGNIFEVLAVQLLSGKIVLFFGLGCDVAAALEYCAVRGIDTTNLYTVDILCHGPAAKGVHENFVKNLEREFHSKLIYYNVRYKEEGWEKPYIKGIFENGNIYIEEFGKSDFGKAFYRIACPTCTNCKFKGDKHRGDLCIGDYWGIKKYMSGWNKNGVSLMVVQSAKGKKLVQSLEGDFVLSDANEKIAFSSNPMYLYSRQQKADYDKFMKDMDTDGLSYAVRQFPTDNKQSAILQIWDIIKKYVF